MSIELFDVLTYDTTKATGVLDIGEVYQNIATLVTPSRPAGKYEVSFAFTWALASANKSAYMRWQLNGLGWNEFRGEPKDATDIYARYYGFPYDFAAGVKTLEFEARKEDSQAGQFDITFLDLIIKRVGA